MKGNYSINILGSGTSTGIPMLGCNCAVCKSKDPLNKRLRTSFLITTKSNKKVLIDAGPDFRTQALRAQIDNIDFCILTHDHADHLHGIDDLRPFTFGDPPKSINIYTFKECAQSVEMRFGYIFKEHKKPILGGGIPRLCLKEITEFLTPIMIEDETFHFFKLPHGHGQTMGLIYEKMAIVIDCHEITSEVLDYLCARELDAVFLDCVKEGVHNTHLTLEKSMEYATKIQAKSTYLVHMSHHLEHHELAQKVSKLSLTKCLPAYDTMHVYL